VSDTSSAAARASALLDLGRAKDAERELRSGLASSPQDPQLHIDLTRALLMQGRHPEALDASASALALAPDHPYALYIRSVAQAASEDLHGARSSIDAALRQAPEAAILHRQRGHLLHQDERPAEALASFEKARSLDPEDADGVTAVAAALYDLRRDDEAAAAIAEALALDPDCAEAHRIRSLHALRGGTSRDAVMSSRDAVRLDPTNAQSRAQLAVAMKARNPLYRALWRYSDWMDAQPDHYKTIALFAPFVLTRVLRGVGGDALWVNILVGLLIAVVALTWLIEPLMNTVMLASRYGRGLLPVLTKRATYAFIAFIVVAIGCVVGGLTTDLDGLLLVALGAALWSATAGSIPAVPEHRRRIVSILTACAGAMILIAIALVAAGATLGVVLSMVVLITGVAFLWIVAAMTR